MRDVAQVLEEGQINREIAQDGLGRLGIDENGLTAMDRKLIEPLAKSGGSCSSCGGGSQSGGDVDLGRKLSALRDGEVISLGDMPLDELFDPEQRKHRPTSSSRNEPFAIDDREAIVNADEIARLGTGHDPSLGLQIDPPRGATRPAPGSFASKLGMDFVFEDMVGGMGGPTVAGLRDIGSSARLQLEGGPPGGPAFQIDESENDESENNESEFPTEKNPRKWGKTRGESKPPAEGETAAKGMDSPEVYKRYSDYLRKVKEDRKKAGTADWNTCDHDFGAVEDSIAVEVADVNSGCILLTQHATFAGNGAVKRVVGSERCGVLHNLISLLRFTDQDISNLKARLEHAEGLVAEHDKLSLAEWLLTPEGKKGKTYWRKEKELADEVEDLKAKLAKSEAIRKPLLRKVLGASCDSSNSIVVADDTHLISDVARSLESITEKRAWRLCEADDLIAFTPDPPLPSNELVAAALVKKVEEVAVGADNTVEIRSIDKMCVDPCKLDVSCDYTTDTFAFCRVKTDVSLPYHIETGMGTCIAMFVLWRLETVVKWELSGTFRLKCKWSLG